MSQQGSMLIGTSFPPVAPPLLSPMDVNMMEQSNKEQASTSQLHFTQAPLFAHAPPHPQQQHTRQNKMKSIDSGVTGKAKFFILDGAMSKYPDEVIVVA